MPNNTGNENEGVPQVGILEYLKNNWGLVASASYIYLTIIGMVQSWVFFRPFGINVFEYSETNDFLLAAFRKPSSVIIGIILGGIVVGYPLFIFRFIAPRLSPKRKKYYVTGAIVVGILLCFCAAIIPHLRSDHIEQLINDNERRVKVSVRMGEIKDRDENKVLHLIGTTERYVFFLDSKPESNDSIAIPDSNIVEMRFIRNDENLAEIKNKQSEDSKKEGKGLLK